MIMMYFYKKLWGFNRAKELHVVIGISENRLWFITAYYPSLAKWESDYKTRKEEKQYEVFFM